MINTLLKRIIYPLIDAVFSMVSLIAMIIIAYVLCYNFDSPSQSNALVVEDGFFIVINFWVGVVLIVMKIDTK